MQIPIKSILVFHAAARAGSISRAAEELSVTPSAVSQQIQLLEGQLGTTLMARTGRKVTLTEAGERYFSMITAQIEQISDATDSIRGFRSVTALTIRATPTISNIPLFAPAIMAGVPSAGPFSPPDTGASTYLTPYAIGTTTEIELMTGRTSPGFMAETMPGGPSRTALQTGPEVSMQSTCPRR